MAASRDALVRKRARIEPPFPSEETEEEEQCSPKMAAVSRIALVMCGSFSPVTNLHLRMFEIARDFLHKDGKNHVAKGIISPVHDAYNKKGLVSSNHRVTMCKLATQSSDWIMVNPWETQQDGWLETAKVLRHLQQSLDSEKEKVKLNLLCGGDLLESFATPGLWSDEHIQEIVETFGLVVISRSGTNPERFIYESDQLSLLRKHIHLVTEWIPNDISSTKIRRSLRRGESVRYLIPDPVLDFIKQNKLYLDDI